MERGHKWYKCKEFCAEPGCMFCEGGLGWCTVCDAFEGQLLTTCPGYKLNEDALNACYHGNVKDLDVFRHAVSSGARIKNGRLLWKGWSYAT
jgi:hypothetical protein